MQTLNLPPYSFRTREEGGKKYIFDVLRKKWMTLTPEEWVRQSFIRYLIEECEFPASRIGTEITIAISGRKLRADAVVYDKYGKVIVLLEFKAPSVPINEKVFSQTADYNTKVGAKYIIVSNGMSHYCAQSIDHSIQLLNALPKYPQL